MQKALRRRLAVLAVFGACSLVAVAIGAYICALNGVGSALWLCNLVGWGIGAILAAGLAHIRRAEALHFALWAAPIALLATFLSPAQEGVHRWVEVGPLHINAAMFTLPAATVSLGALSRDRVWSWIAPFTALTLLVLQPDASQATTLGAVMVAVAAATSSRPLLQGSVIIGAIGLAILAWFKCDPLQPVPEVEDVIELGLVTAPLLTVVAVSMIVVAAVSVERLTRYLREAPRIAAWALSVCLLSWLALTFFGAYPVPWIGIGLSPIIGAWVGVGLLAGLRRGAM